MARVAEMGIVVVMAVIAVVIVVLTVRLGDFAVGGPLCIILVSFRMQWSNYRPPITPSLDSSGGYKTQKNLLIRNIVY